MAKMILSIFIGFGLIILICHVFSIGTSPAEAFEKTEHFNREVKPQELDRQLQLMAAAIDRLENIHSEVIFYGYDGIADTVLITQTGYLTIDSILIEDDAVYHRRNGAFVFLNKDGWYSITANASVKAGSGAVGDVYMYLYGMSSSYAVSTIPLSGFTSISISACAYMSADDSTAIALVNAMSGDAAVTIPNTVRLSIAKIDYGGIDGN